LFILSKEESLTREDDTGLDFPLSDGRDPSIYTLSLLNPSDRVYKVDSGLVLESKSAPALVFIRSALLRGTLSSFDLSANK
jgi:hypothetical protein